MVKKLPEELISDIISRIPVKSILRFRCVCKTWCALIDTNHFIKKHLNHSILTKSNHTLTLYQFYPRSICSLNSLLNLFSPQQQQQPQLIQSLIPNKLMNMFFNSCNGLHCVSLYQDSGNVIVIWNPSTRKHVKIPKFVVKNPFTVFAEDLDTIYGFGYDSVSDDYRVVMLVQFSGGGLQICFRSEAYVYSLRSNTWKKVSGFPNYRFNAQQVRCVLVSGALHFLIMVERGKFEAKVVCFDVVDRGSNVQFESKVVSFDIVTEECNVITLPNYGQVGVVSSILSELGGCLAIVSKYIEVDIISVWVMKEYGVTESWIRLLTIGSQDINPLEHFMPLVYSESGEEVLFIVNFGKFIWYHLEKKTFKVVDVCGIPEPCYPVICFESLVSFGENAEKDENQGVRKEGAKKKRNEKDHFLSVGFKLVL